MAGLTGRRRMRAGERELRRTVIKRGGLPDSCHVARLTNVAEPTGNVIRICRGRKICRVTLVATRIGELIVAIDVARLAWRRCMCARQRELRRTVIKRRWLPHGRRVACLANVAQTCCHVIRICRRGKI